MELEKSEEFLVKKIIHLAKTFISNENEFKIKLAIIFALRQKMKRCKNSKIAVTDDNKKIWIMVDHQVLDVFNEIDEFHEIFDFPHKELSEKEFKRELAHYLNNSQLKQFRSRLRFIK
jgi:hypothetical protein